jgi:hypothetical protein
VWGCELMFALQAHWLVRSWRRLKSAFGRSAPEPVLRRVNFSLTDAPHVQAAKPNAPATSLMPAILLYSPPAEIPDSAGEPAATNPAASSQVSSGLSGRLAVVDRLNAPKSRTKRTRTRTAPANKHVPKRLAPVLKARPSNTPVKLLPATRHKMQMHEEPSADVVDLAAVRRQRTGKARRAA